MVPGVEHAVRSSVQKVQLHCHRSTWGRPSIDAAVNAVPVSTRHAYSRTTGSHVFPCHTRSNACVSDGVSASLNRLCIVIAAGVIVFRPGDKMRRPACTLKVSRSQISRPVTASSHCTRRGIQLYTSWVGP